MADGDLDAAVRRADPDRWLASRFIADRDARADVIALYALDGELARSARIATNPVVGQLRLAWWREAVAEILAGRPARAHPVLVAVASAHRRRQLPLAPLEAMIETRIDVLESPIADVAEAKAWADGVAGSANLLAAHVLDPASPAEPAAIGGRVWGLLLLRRSGGVSRSLLDPLLADALSAARIAARRVSAAAFPAIAAATLAGPELAGRQPSALETRLRIVLAVARGRL